MSEQPLVERLHAFFVQVFTTHDLFDKDKRQEMKLLSFELDDKVAQLEEENAKLKREIKGLREASRAVIHDLTIGDFTSKAGGDAAYLLSIMELRDALLTTEEQE